MTCTGRLLLLLFLLHTIHAGAQRLPDFNFPSHLPKPCWVDRVNWNAPNIFTIDSLMRSCGDMEEEEEEPYREAFVRWLKQTDVFVGENGNIRIDPDSARRMLRTAIRNQRAAMPVLQQRAAAGTASWTVLGPLRTYGGGVLKNWQVNVYSFAIAPSNPSVLYCGSETGVIFKSTDKGLTWTSVNDALINNSVRCIAINPSDPNIVYAYSGSLLKSSDGGTTWSSLANYAGGNANEIVINPVSGRILTASANGIYYSDNSGVNWTKATTSINPGTEIYDISLNPSNPNIVYAVCANNTTVDSMIMYRSVNAGNSFTSVTLPPATYSTGARFAVSPANAAYVYCITLQNDFPKLMMSTDSGATWTTRLTFSGTGLTGSNSTNGMSTGQGYYDLDIMVSPADINKIIVGTTTAYRSADGGLNFSPLGGYAGSFPLHPDIQWMAASGNDAYITTDGGISYSTDFFGTTANCSSRVSGLSGSDYWGFGQGWSEDIVTGGRYHNGNAALFDEYGAGNSYQLGGGESPTGHVFQIPGYQRVTGFQDLGSSLKIIPPAVTGSTSNAPFTNNKWPGDDYYGAFSSKLMQDPRYANIFYVGRDSCLWKSDNYGKTYTKLKHFGTTVWRFDIARSNPDIIYICTKTSIMKTIDGGVNWTTLSLPTSVTYSYYNTDIAVNPANENEVWFCQAGGASANKVFKSTNGGSSWTNMTGTALNAKSVAYVLFQGGTNGGVYAVLNSTSAKVYYRDASMTDWVDYSAGLPVNFKARQGGLIFYRDGKIRLTGNRGTWESPLYSSGAPLAMPMANKQYVSCSKDTVVFKDHSILEYAGASWSWSFPGAAYVSGTTGKEVKVTYPGPGNYHVGLTVTDAQGRVSSRTIQNMISFTKDNCSVDTVAGKCLALNGAGAEYSIGTANINSNSFSISCWIRPYGVQKSFSQLVSHDPYPGASYGFGLGFSFSGYTPNLKLCYTDNVVGYGNSSSLIADSTRWNFVVLTYSPTGVKIYLNGVAATVNSNAMAAIDLSQSPFYVNRDIHNQGGDYKGLIDEVKIYNYALSQNEVREKMHLISSSGLSETGLLKYVQFNKLDKESVSVYELVSGSGISLGDSNVLTASYAPVGTGVSYRKTAVSTSGQHSFPGTGVDLFLPATGTYPNGEVVAFRLRSLPFNAPDSAASHYVPDYFILNNYGTNSTFSALQKIRFSNLNVLHNGYSLSNFNAYKRRSGDYDGAAWGASLGNASSFTYVSPGNSVLEFPGTGITSFSQFVITEQKSATTMMNMKVFIQGYTGANQQMNPAMMNAGVTGSNETQVDTISIEIRNGSNGSLLRGPVKTILNTDGSAVAGFPVTTGSHYIVIKGRNAVETWSAVPVAMGETVSYDFSSSAAAAFGSNEVSAGGVYAMWSGDLNQDGVVETSDYAMMENSVLAILFGYYPADLTGDGVVETEDYSLMENNILKIIFVARPF